jgi:hypothetical protein
MLDNLVPQGQRELRFPLGSAAGPWAPGGGDKSSDVARPRRGVRSAQANFSAAVPTPQFDASHDAMLSQVSLYPAPARHWLPLLACPHRTGLCSR